MNSRSKEIIEEAISQGKWVWLEIDDNSNSLYLEFENLKLSSRLILDNSYRGELAIRFGQNIFALRSILKPNFKYSYASNIIPKIKM